MTKIKDAIEAIAWAAVLGGLDEAGTVDISELLGITGDAGALVTGIAALVLAYVTKVAKAEVEKDETPAA